MKRIAPTSIEAFKEFPAAEDAKAEVAVRRALDLCPHKVVVLDDDPTGTQTVHDIRVYTDWEKETVFRAFQEPDRMFYILTNSRAMTEKQTVRAHKEIAASIVYASRNSQKPYIVVSRSDSTLRGYFPLETETLRAELTELGEPDFDGEILYPFFLEGGRYTFGNVHYVREGEFLVPAGQTEFVKDKSFGYGSSDLTEWCEEKSGGRYAAGDVTCISLEDLRAQAYDKITEQLMGVSRFGKIIVNSVDYADVKVFIAAYLRAVSNGKRFIFRSAAAIPKILGEVSDQPLLAREELVDPQDMNGGLMIVGSHVQKTTAQLRALQESGLPIRFIEFNQHRVLEPNGLEQEARRVSAEAEQHILAGTTVAVYTRRDRLDLDTDDANRQLEISVRISQAITSIVANLNIRPRFILAKGGITSSSIGTDALRIRRAMVMGQVYPGIPVWRTGGESKFPQMPYIIFPGNVGSEDTLLEIVKALV